MKLLAAFLLLLTAALTAQSSPCPPETALIAPNNPAYPDAMALQQRLQQHDFTVHCIFPTKLNSVFMVEKDGALQSTIEGEACFNTNYGAFDVIFVPKPEILADFKITERRKDHGYLYRFTGTPRVAAGDKFNFGTATRQYFLKHDNFLIMVSDNQLRARLEAALAPQSKP
jgi:hypothetical protein